MNAAHAHHQPLERVNKLSDKGSEAANDFIQIQSLESETLHVPIIGTRPLIVSNFSEKSKRQMLDKQQHKTASKQPRDPLAEYQAAFYRIASEDGGPDRYGIPAVAFKKSMVSAARLYKGVTMATLLQVIFMHGVLSKADRQELVEITGTPEMREDIVRLSGVGRTPESRFRPMFPEWSATLKLTYVKNVINRDSLLSLIEAAGLTVGVGEWRPENKGQFGTYAIDRSRSVEIDAS